MDGQMVFVGADGCRAGWFAVSLTDTEDWQVKVFSDVRSLWDVYGDAAVILLDIPIGLRGEGHTERLCDNEARRLLAPKRHSSVFPAPCRPATRATTHQEASEINEQMTGRRLPIQTWSIIPKIRDVDDLLADNDSARSHIREVHPEICFWSLAGGRPMQYSKKAREGFAERLELLQSAYTHTDNIIDCALSTRKRKEVARDDILDALSAALTAIVGMEGLASIPESPELDARGLAMEMVYRPDYLP